MTDASSDATERGTASTSSGRLNLAIGCGIIALSGFLRERAAARRQNRQHRKSQGAKLTGPVSDRTATSLPWTREAFPSSLPNGF